MNTESKGAHTIRRKVVVGTLGPTLFRSETLVEPETNGFADFESKVAEGYGGIIVFKHFSLKDPAQVFKPIFSSPVLREKEFVIPSAIHQTYPGMVGFSALVGVKIDRVVTKRSVEKALEKGKPAPVLNEGSEEFVRDAIDYLKRGQLVVVAPEATRKNTLETYGTNSVGTLLGAARLARAKVAVICLDMRLAGRKEGYWDKSGPNLLNKYELRFGRMLTGDEIIAMAGNKYRDVDEKVIVTEMQRTAAIPRPNGV